MQQRTDSEEEDTTQTVARKQLQKTDPYLTLCLFAAGDIELDPGSIEQVLFGNTNELFSEPQLNTKFITWIQMLWVLRCLRQIWEHRNSPPTCCNLACNTADNEGVGSAGSSEDLSKFMAEENGRLTFVVHAKDKSQHIWRIKNNSVYIYKLYRQGRGKEIASEHRPCQEQNNKRRRACKKKCKDARSPHISCVCVWVRQKRPVSDFWPHRRTVTVWQSRHLEQAVVAEWVMGKGLSLRRLGSIFIFLQTKFTYFFC